MILMVSTAITRDKNNMFLNFCTILFDPKRVRKKNPITEDFTKIGPVRGL